MTYSHIVNTGVSILETKFPEIGLWEGGSFVKAVVNNDLECAIATADNDNVKYLKFYVQLICNFTTRDKGYNNI